MSSKEECFYSSFQQGIALVRSGLKLNHSKAWAQDATLVDSNDPRAFLPAHSLQDLMPKWYASLIEFSVSGNFIADIHHNFKLLMKYYKSKNQMPFRVWNGSAYCDIWHNNLYHLLPCGEFVSYTRGRMPGQFMSNGDSFLRKVTIEYATGSFDMNDIIIMQGDAVLREGTPKLVVRHLENGSWGMVDLEGGGFEPIVDPTSLSVVGSYRLDWVKSKIA